MVQDSKILHLPKEIQLDILSFLLVEPDRPVKLRSANHRRWRNELRNLQDIPAVPDRSWRLTDHDRSFVALFANDMPHSAKSELLAVLLVCKAWYFVGIEAFYGGNTLHFGDASHLRQFLNKTDSDRRACIKQIELDMEWVAERKLIFHPKKSSARFSVEWREWKDDVTSNDPLVAMPRLQRVVIKATREWSNRTTWTGSMAGIETELEAMLRSAWNSKPDLLRFEFSSCVATL